MMTIAVIIAAVPEVEEVAVVAEAAEVVEEAISNRITKTPRAPWNSTLSGAPWGLLSSFPTMFKWLAHK